MAQKASQEPQGRFGTNSSSTLEDMELENIFIFSFTENVLRNTKGKADEKIPKSLLNRVKLQRKEWVSAVLRIKVILELLEGRDCFPHCFCSSEKESESLSGLALAEFCIFLWEVSLGIVSSHQWNLLWLLLMSSSGLKGDKMLKYFQVAPFQMIWVQVGWIWPKFDQKIWWQVSFLTSLLVLTKFLKWRNVENG